MFYLCDTVANIPLLALEHELYDDFDHRTSKDKNNVFFWETIYYIYNYTNNKGIGSPFIYYYLYKVLVWLQNQHLNYYQKYLFHGMGEQSLSQQPTPFVASISRSFGNIAFKALAIV